MHTSPGIFYGWHIDPGGEWHVDYLVLRLSDFEKDNDRVFPVRVKEIYPAGEAEFPMKAVKDRALLERLKPHLGDEEPGQCTAPTARNVTVDATTQTAELASLEPSAGEPPTVEPLSHATESLPPGYVDVAGRPTRRYKGTTRPPHIWPEVWQMMSRKQEQIAIKQHKEAEAALQPETLAAPVTDASYQSAWEDLDVWVASAAAAEYADADGEQWSFKTLLAEMRTYQEDLQQPTR